MKETIDWQFKQCMLIVTNYISLVWQKRIALYRFKSIIYCFLKIWLKFECLQSVVTKDQCIYY